MNLFTFIYLFIFQGLQFKIEFFWGENRWCDPHYIKGSIRSSIWSKYKIKGKEAQRYIQQAYLEYLNQYEFQGDHNFNKWWLDLSQSNLCVRGAWSIYNMDIIIL
jgi:hypothetical protein